MLFRPIALRLTLAALLMTSFSLPAYPDIDLPSGEPLDRSSYTETTAGDSIALTAREWRVPEGLVLESSDSRGDRHIVIVNDTLETQAWQFRSERDQTRLDVTRNGGGVSIRGTVAGEPVEREADLPEPLWIQSIERSLRRFVVDGEAGDRIRFAVVQPDTLSARTLEARIMGDEQITIRGEAVPARRVRISLPGIGAIIWRSNYWFRLPDGLFVQSRVTRGPPGTPETVVSLVADGG